MCGGGGGGGWMGGLTWDSYLRLGLVLLENTYVQVSVTANR